MVWLCHIMYLTGWFCTEAVWCSSITGYLPRHAGWAPRAQQLAHMRLWWSLENRKGPNTCPREDGCDFSVKFAWTAEADPIFDYFNKKVPTSYLQMAQRDSKNAGLVLLLVKSLGYLLWFHETFSGWYCQIFSVIGPAVQPHGAVWIQHWKFLANRLCQ